MPYYNRDPKRDHNFDNHPHERNGLSGFERPPGAGSSMGRDSTNPKGIYWDYMGIMENKMETYYNGFYRVYIGALHDLNKPHIFIQEPLMSFSVAPSSGTHIFAQAPVMP